LSSQDSPFTFSEDAWKEIKDKQETLKNAIFAEAIHLAYKDGHDHIDKTYIRKASKRIKMLGSNDTMVWVLRIFLFLILPLMIGIQIKSGLLASEVLASPIGSQISLWLLPIFSIVFIIIFSWVFKDSIF